MQLENISVGTFGDELPDGQTKIRVSVDCENQGRMLHVVRGTQQASGKSGEFRVMGREQVFYVDEPPALGGEDRYPQPLTYVAGGVGT